MDSPEEIRREEAEQVAALRDDLENWPDQLARASRLGSVLATLSVLLVGAIGAYGGYLFGRAESDVRTVERVGDPRMHMRIAVAGGEATVYVHPVRRAEESASGVPDITFTTELPNALAALPAEAFCGDATALTLCAPHLVRLGPDSTAYVMEPEASRLDAGLSE